jgi:hypothetical protein
METYANISGQSGVIRYLIGDNHIIVEFTPNKYSNITFYKYTYASAGQAAVDHMKALAMRGSGLHTYINTTDVKQNYSMKGPSLISVQ